MDNKIIGIDSFEILDSRANPTIVVEMTDSSGHIAKASVPSGASTGKYEAYELRDDDKTRYLGKGVLKAVENIKQIIAPLLIGQDVMNPDLEDILITLDQSGNKSVIGANAILACSLSLRRLVAINEGKELFETFKGPKSMPVPMMNILNGGAHADNNLDIQEFMIMPIGFETFSNALRASVEVYHTLKTLLKRRGYRTGVGDEGGFAPNLSSTGEALDLICEAIKTAGYEPGKEFFLALDVAASEWTTDEVGKYHLPKSDQVLTSDELIEHYQYLIKHYPIYSIEDGLGEEDYDGFKKMTKELKNIMIVGDDLFVTNVKRLEDGIRGGYGNAVLIKYNQIGTIKETLETIKLAKDYDYKTIISHRSGETGDTFIADLAVGTNSMFIKAGAPARYERTIKYNRLLEIESKYGLPYAGKSLKKV